ncbi:42305_t:CDS:2, partial [Gigaspora margarita]
DEDQKSNKKQKVDIKNKEDILKYIENQELTPKRQEQLENGMCLAFVCAGISFNVAKNKIFHTWLQDLRPGFKIPGFKTLAWRIFNKQIIRVEAKMESEIQNKNYITLKHLYALCNYSNMHHTSEFLIQEIETIVTQIGAEKICAVVSDNGANVAAAWRLITQKFPHIVNVSCIAHWLNLICKDIMKEFFLKRVLSQAILVVQFFKSSHIANLAFENKIQINNIVGRGIKQYVVTHWSSYYDTIYSILCLKVAFIRILEHDLDIITNNEVYSILNRGLFYDDLYFMTTVLQPIKESIVQLERQLASYKLSKPPFNEPFKPDCQTPQTWWKTIEDVYDHLSTLAVKLLNITPHSASFEALAKIHRYYTTHAKEEISYINCELTLEDVLAVANETLDLKEIFDLNHKIFRENAEEDPNYNYDVDDLVDEVFV